MKLVVWQTIFSTMFWFWNNCSFLIIPTIRHNIKDLSWNQIYHNVSGGVTFFWWIYQKSALVSKHFFFIFDFTCRSNCASAVSGSCREFRIAKRLHSCQSLKIFREFSTFVSFFLKFPSPCQKVTLSVSVGHNDLNDIVLQNSKAINFQHGKQFYEICPGEKGF